MADLKQVTVTKTVPVNDAATLAEWLNQELDKHVSKTWRDGGESKRHLGDYALSLIRNAGFTLNSPVTNRHPGGGNPRQKEKATRLPRRGHDIMDSLV